MGKLDLSLRVFVIGGDQIGSFFGVPAKIFNVQGGKVQPLENAAHMDNEMLIADEFKEAIHRQNLLVIRDSDALSVELYRAFEKRAKLLVMPSVYSVEKSGLMKGAHLTIRNATIKQFKIGKSAGIINQDAILFRFASSDTEIHYGSNSAELFKSELIKVANAVAAGAQRIGKQLGL